MSAATNQHAMIVVKCCECNRVRREGQWLSQEDHEQHNVVYSHGYCPACLVRAYEHMTMAEACAG